MEGEREVVVVPPPPPLSCFPAAERDTVVIRWVPFFLPATRPRPSALVMGEDDASGGGTAVVLPVLPLGSSSDTDGPAHDHDDEDDEDEVGKKEVVMAAEGK